MCVVAEARRGQTYACKMLHHIKLRMSCHDFLTFDVACSTGLCVPGEMTRQPLFNKLFHRSMTLCPIFCLLEIKATSFIALFKICNRKI
jgi:hypothetical protein